MSKESVILCAAMSLPCCASSAVQLYGVADLGLTYTNVKHGDSSLTMDSGNYAGSRFGFKGTENIAPGLHVGFILEAGFNADTGASGVSGKLFNRGSILYLQSDSLGTLGFGRMGGFTTGTGHYGWGWEVDAFEAAYLDAGIQASQMDVWAWRDNVISYLTPKIGNFQFGVMVSLTGNSVFGDNYGGSSSETTWCRDDHWWNAAVRYETDATLVVAGLQGMKYGNDSSTPDADDPLVLKIGIRQAVGPAKVFAGYSYARDWRYLDNMPGFAYGADLSVSEESEDGITMHSGYLGIKYPVLGGEAIAQYQYLTGRNCGAEEGAGRRFRRHVVAAGFQYWLGRQSMAYVIGSWAENGGAIDGDGKQGNRFAAHVGLAHFF